MFKAKEVASKKSHDLINHAFNQVMGEGHSYTVVYGYFMKSGLFSKKLFNYVVGFNPETLEIVIVSIDTDGNTSDKVVLNKNTVSSAKYNMQGGVVIKSTELSQPMKLIVPAFTAANASSMYMLPIVQEAQEKQFREMIKNSF